jgi:hypothetical protein
MSQNRKEIVFEKYKNQCKNQSLLQDAIDFFLTNDPSGTNKYLDWSIGISIKKDINIEDADKINQLVKEFDYYLNSISVKSVINYFDINNIEVEKKSAYYKIIQSPKDIYSYPSFGILSDIMSYIVEMVSSKKEIKEKYWAECDIVMEDDYYIILTPLTHQASVFFGLNTKWCTAMKDCSNHFDSYMQSGNLYYIIDKQRTSRDYPLSKIGYHIKYGESRGSAFNAPDTGIGDISNILGDKYKEIILNHFQKDNNFDLIIETIKKEFKYCVGETFMLDGGLKLQLKSQSKNEFIFKIFGFPDWTISFELLNIETHHLMGVISLKRNDRNIDINYNTKIEYSVGETISYIRRLSQGEKVSVIDYHLKDKIKHHFLHNRDRVEKNLLNTISIKSFIIYYEIKKLLSTLSDKNWRVSLHENVKCFNDDHNLTFEIRHLKTNPREPLTLKMSFDSLLNIGPTTINIDYELRSYKSDKYEWIGFSDDCCITSFKLNDITSKLSDIFNKVKKYIVEKRIKIKKEVIHIKDLPPSATDNCENNYGINYNNYLTNCLSNGD